MGTMGAGVRDDASSVDRASERRPIDAAGTSDNPSSLPGRDNGGGCDGGDVESRRHLWAACAAPRAAGSPLRKVRARVQNPAQRNGEAHYSSGRARRVQFAVIPHHDEHSFIEERKRPKHATRWTSHRLPDHQHIFMESRTCTSF